LGGGFFGALPAALSAFLSTLFPAGFVVVLPLGFGGDLPGLCTVNFCTPKSVMSCSCGAPVEVASVRAGGAAADALFAHAGAGSPWVEPVLSWAGHWRYTDAVTAPREDTFTCTLLACRRADSSKISATSVIRKFDIR
jgi:hypothetical protein